ncbi:hypothetical protein ONJ95_26645, partial [Salmonella enterica subsp. enterica serovar Virginia]|nr:hypothetical protein [Salmonella enterica subsp. enterica serovar Virginia]
YLASHVRDMAMNQAKIIASNDSIIAAVKNRDYKRLAIIANKLQRAGFRKLHGIADFFRIRMVKPDRVAIAYHHIVKIRPALQF